MLRWHWVLGTSYSRASAGVFIAVVANDPWLGRQVRIDPATKKVVWPTGFPFPGFTLDGYQVVAIKPPPAAS